MIHSYLKSAAASYARLAADERYASLFGEMADVLISALKNGNKILFAGNGGSAADCQHLAGELVVKFRLIRPGLPGIALTVDSSVLTAALNDFGPDPVFSRQVEALGREGDILWAFSTSGTSVNILNACESAAALGMKIIGFTGEEGGFLPGVCDYCFKAPAKETSHVQECHIAAGHLLCLVIERRLFASD